jgi:hypothetical protein
LGLGFRVAADIYELSMLGATKTKNQLLQKCAFQKKNTEQLMCEECLVHHESKGEYRQREDVDRGLCSDEWRLAFETTRAAALAPPCCTGSECARAS